MSQLSADALLAASLIERFRTTILLACVLVSGSLAQDGQVFRSNVEIVAVPFSVVDGSGAAVGNLTRDELRVYSDDVRRQIQNVWVDNDLPLTLGVIIDSN